MPHLPESLIEIITTKLTDNPDRNSISLVNKLWYKIDRANRQTVHVSNSQAVNPTRVTDRFPNLRSLVLKGGKCSITNVNVNVVVNPMFGVGNDDWDVSVDRWVKTLRVKCPMLERLEVKGMVVTDESLAMIASGFPCFKALVLCKCEGFTIAGVKAVGANCTKLEELEVERCNVTDLTQQWLRCFPETLTSLVSLNISCIKGEMNPLDLSRLVARCPNLTTLKVNKTVAVDTIRNILLKSPHVVHLGLGSTQVNVLQDGQSSHLQLTLCLRNYGPIQSLMLIYRISALFLHAMYPVCINLVFLNMRFVEVRLGSELVKFITRCTNLKRLWVQGTCIGDEGLEVISNNCKSLEDLRVFKGNGSLGVTEAGLTSISTSCRKLKSLTYYCSQMTNTALVTFSKNCPNITRFKLILSPLNEPDHTTLQAFDHGFGAVVESCKDLKKLTASGLLTDDVFLYIAMYAERLEVLSVSSVCQTDVGLQYVFNGCMNLKKVCSFGEDAFSADAFEY
ncbi:protein AUXIN SIGNALING F-BOX 2-like [Bidens hawaiensis]|uniref:protein AUXIN SIGNALING F-BOX 2-like n=1 Tax=Bidens hawaiensis TaxID=980011 RepID=UPI00404A6028